MDKLIQDLMPILASVVVCFIRSSFCAEVDDGLTTLMAYASSRTAISRIVFEGELLGIDKKAAPYRIMARFEIKEMFKGSFGDVVQQPKSIWIASHVPSYQYDCLRELSISTNYVVYLNGTYSRLWMAVNASDNTETKRATTNVGITESFQNKFRKIYWTSALPQKVNPKRLKEVKKYCCSDCSRKPEASLTYASKKDENNLTRIIVLTCKLLGDCKLVSLFEWFKDGYPLDEKEQNQSYVFVESRKYTSSLTIKKYTNQHHRGRYHCKVINVIGKEDSRTLSLPQTRSTLTTKRMTTLIGTYPHEGWIECEARRCNYKGRCFTRHQADDNFVCYCQRGWEGTRCELDDHHGDETWGELQPLTAQSVTLFIVIPFVILIFISLIIIICCFSRLKRDVSRVEVLQRSLSISYKPEDQVDQGLQSVKQDSSSNQISRENKPVNPVINGDSKQPPGSPSKTKEIKSSQSSPMFNMMRLNYEPLESKEKADKSMKTSPIFGRMGLGYRPLSPTRTGNESSSFIHYVIGPPGNKTPKGHKTPPTSVPLLVGRSSEEGSVDPKIEEDLKGILKELGEYVNDNQVHG